jgi:hypothetical protein
MSCMLFICICFPVAAVPSLKQNKWFYYFFFGDGNMNFAFAFAATFLEEIFYRVYVLPLDWWFPLL